MGIKPSQNPWVIVYKTGNRVQVSGHYVDQDGETSRHLEHGTFPPTFKTKSRAGGDCAYYRLSKLL